MVQCEKQMTVFGAINGNTLVNVQMINEYLKLDQVKQQLDQAISGTGITYTIDPNTVTDLNVTYSLFHKTNKG